MDSYDLKKIRHPIEESRFVITVIVLVFTGILGLILFLGTFGLLLIYIVPIVLLVWVSSKIARSHYLNNLVLVTEENFPIIYKSIHEAKDAFRYSDDVEAYIYEKGEYNILLKPLVGKRIILVNSEILVSKDFENEIRFMIGRFVGALASRHFRLMWVEVFLDTIEKLRIFNPLLYSYERAIVYSGDRLGLHFCGGKIGSASNVLVKTMVGRDAAPSVDIAAFLQQGAQSKSSFSAWLAQIFSAFPHNTLRLANLAIYAKEEFPEELEAYFKELGPDRARTFKDYANILRKT